jgi:hypothetical protein
MTRGLSIAGAIFAVAVAAACIPLPYGNRTVVLEEPAAGMVSWIATEVLGSEADVDGVTLPDGTSLILVKDPSPCLIKHEETHQRQLAEESLGLVATRYTLELYQVGYTQVSYEREARAVQDACAARRDRGLR